MKKDTIIIGTRSSKLALWQADYVADCLRKEYPGLRVEKKLVTTKGDKILNAPLAKIGGKGLFTKELEEFEELKKGNIAVALEMAGVIIAVSLIIQSGITGITAALG